MGLKGYGFTPEAFSISGLVRRRVRHDPGRNTIAHHTIAAKTHTAQASLRDATYLVILRPDCQVLPRAPPNIAANCHMCQHTCRV